MATTQRNTNEALQAVRDGGALHVDTARALYNRGLVTLHIITRGPGGQRLDRSQWAQRAILTAAGKAALKAT